MTIDEINNKYKGTWEWIDNYENLYAVSDQGQILSLHRSNPNILKGSVSGMGYLSICLCVNSVHERFYIHRLVGEKFVEKNNDTDEINHINGNKKDNRAINLEWCTRRENLMHAIENGLHHTEEIRKMHSKRMKKWIKQNGNPASKRVMVIETGEIFESQSELARHIDLLQTTISEHCNGNIKNQKFKFVDE